jgi:hypothetical protein
MEQHNAHRRREPTTSTSIEIQAELDFNLQKYELATSELMKLEWKKFECRSGWPVEKQEIEANLRERITVLASEIDALHQRLEPFRVDGPTTSNRHSSSP